MFYICALLSYLKRNKTNTNNNKKTTKLLYVNYINKAHKSETLYLSSHRGFMCDKTLQYYHVKHFSIIKLSSTSYFKESDAACLT